MKLTHVISCKTSPQGGHAQLKHLNEIPVDRHSLPRKQSHETIPVARRKLMISISTALAIYPLQTNSSSALVNPPPPTSIDSLSQATSNIQESYNQYAENYDDLDGGAVADALGFPDQRKNLLREATGDVLECAVGTGLNLQYYNLTNLRSFTAIDLSPGMLRQAQRKATSLQFPAAFSNNNNNNNNNNTSSSTSSPVLSFQEADVTALPFPDNSFDSVVDTFSLCVFPDPAAALRSMARVVRPGGKVLLLEHSRSNSPLLGWYQDVTADSVAAMGKGCVWNQNVIKLVENAGLKVERVDSYAGDLVLSITAVKIGGLG